MSQDRNFVPASGLSHSAITESEPKPSNVDGDDIATGFVAAAQYFEKIFGSQAVSERLPAFPWDTLAAVKAKALSHAEGMIDLSVGTPVDSTPVVIQEALAESSNAHGYPTVWGTAELREAIIGYLEKQWDSVPLTETNVLPVIGTKELVAWLPTFLGISKQDTVIIPEIAYPTYAVGARLAHAEAVTANRPGLVSAANVKLIWLNSPANPHGEILNVAQLREWVNFARENSAVLAADECYAEFVWEGNTVSLLNPEVNGGSLDNLLALHSLSKRSNMAGYRAGFVAGDSKLVKELIELRKHLGMMVPLPVQKAMTTALLDQKHVNEQVERYRKRREILKSALVTAGFQISHSQGSLYLWVTRGESGWDTVDFLAELGILAAPGDFYGTAGKNYVRIALTASTAEIQAAAQRLIVKTSS